MDHFDNRPASGCTPRDGVTVIAVIAIAAIVIALSFEGCKMNMCALDEECVTGPSVIQ